jgi:3-methyladenine DNA glycosylase Tag
MRSFADIYAIAADRKGGPEALEALIGAPESTADLAADIAALPDSFFLEEMTKTVFRSGFSWQVIETKWPGFLEAFKGFDVHACAFMDPDWFDALCKDTRIVRNAQKIRSVQDNARFILDCAKEYGSFGKMLANWPASDYVGLLTLLKKNGSRLGGHSGQYFLRFSGKDGFILSRDVVGRLVAEGVIDKEPTSQAAMTAVQAAFSTWAEQSGRSFRDISRTLALSID